MLFDYEQLEHKINIARTKILNKVSYTSIVGMYLSLVPQMNIISLACT